MTDLLILGGTTEARLLCDEVHALGIDAVVSLAGATANPSALNLPVRSGGFGGPDGLADWMRKHDVRCIIDATHPFAARMPWNACQACAATGTRRLRLLRPRFRRQLGWVGTPDLASALSGVPPSHRVLLTTGRQDLNALQSRPDLEILLRTIEPVTDLPTNATAMRIQPPLGLQDELDLLSGHRIETLIAKDSGGTTAPKLEAAGQLGIQVILIDRPEQPPGPTVETVRQAVAWLEHLVAFSG